VRGIAALEAGGIDLIEQPVRADNPDALRRLAARFDVAVMADEALHGPIDAFNIARHHGADVFAVKIAQSGGLFPAQQVATVAQLAGIGLYGGTMLEGGVGTAATAHLCATFADLSWDTELFGPLLLTEEVLEEPLVYKDFALLVPSKPGLGVRVDADKLRRMRRD
jgi:muconate cycloisomerase